MFVVKRPFRNKGKVYTAGSVITDPADIKRFKGRLAEGKIINVTEQTYDKIAKYFKHKHGVDIGEFISESTPVVEDDAHVITPNANDADAEDSTEETAGTTTTDVVENKAVQAVTKVVAAVVK